MLEKGDLRKSEVNPTDFNRGFPMKNCRIRFLGDTKGGLQKVLGVGELLVKI